MDVYGNQRALQQYQQMGMQSQVADANPHRLVRLMLDGALARIAAARGAMEAREVPKKGELIGKAIGLVEGLRVSLDADRGGELAENLEALYDYMTRRLLEANVRNDTAILDEVSSLLREIRDGWVAIGETLADEPMGGGIR